MERKVQREENFDYLQCTKRDFCIVETYEKCSLIQKLDSERYINIISMQPMIATIAIDTLIYIYIYIYMVDSF